VTYFGAENERQREISPLMERPCLY